jgi:glycyl-tRNA synthetase beta chain
MTDFLLELRSEEIPARMQDGARRDLEKLFAAEIAKAGMVAESIATYATPRRLALIAYGLPMETDAVSEETKGPKTSAPPQALEGFLRKTGLTQGQLVDREGVYFAIVEKAGRKTADVLAEAIPAIIRGFPWPKSQRWGAASASTESLRWVRPLQGIVALLGDAVVVCEVDGIVSGAATMGHRFHHSGAITIDNAADYAGKLRAAHVILDQDERRDIIRAGAEKAASDAGLTLVPDEGLVNENAGLTEWPVPMLGRFDPAFLEVPQEVIQLTARVNQKYFVCHDADGKLANAFVCTANIRANDGGAAIVAGNEKVLAARLSDAKFFWEADKKVKLDHQAKKLSSIVFHEKLGTVTDKVERVAKLARWLVESGVVKSAPSTCDGEGDRAAGVVEGTATQKAPPSSDAVAPAATSPSQVDGEKARATAALAAQADRAARLCKADLVTGMVGEFPELQGIMGGYYARAQGEDDAVADAIRDHYKPVGQGDDVPTAPVTVAVSLADKLDTLAGFFYHGIKPSGSKDPYALRRAAIGIINTIIENRLKCSILTLAETALTEFSSAEANAEMQNHGDRVADAVDELNIPSQRALEVTHNELNDRAASLSAFIFPEDLLDFFIDRLKVQQREAGVRHDLIDAVFALGGEDDLVRLLARVKALQAFVDTAEGANLLAGYKRAANILKSSPERASIEPNSSPKRASIESNSSPERASIEPNSSPERGGGPAQLVEGHVEDVPPSKAQETQSVPLHHPADGPPPRSGEELALEAAINIAEPLAAAAIAAEDFAAAMTALASLRAPIDAFFDGVMVNDPDPGKRSFRIGLLTRFRDAVHQVADFSKIEG